MNQSAEKWTNGPMIDEQLVAARIDRFRQRLSSYELWAGVTDDQESYSIKVSVQLKNTDALDIDLIKNIVKTEVKNMGDIVDFFVLATRIYTNIYVKYNENTIRITFIDNNNSEMLFQF